MEKTIGAFEARRMFGQLIEEAFYKKDAFIIERSGRPMAVLVSIDDYQRWQQLGKEQFLTLLHAAQKRNAKAPAADLERDIERGLKQLRQENRALAKAKG